MTDKKRVIEELKGLMGVVELPVRIGDNGEDPHSVLDVNSFYFCATDMPDNADLIAAALNALPYLIECAEAVERLTPALEMFRTENNFVKGLKDGTPGKKWGNYLADALDEKPTEHGKE